MAHLLWIDCEMTGLCPQKDHILEVAAIVTDMSLQSTFALQEWVIHQSQDILMHMEEWVFTLHKSSGLYERVQESSLSAAQVEHALLEILTKYTEKGKVYLAGNSVHCDYAFLKKSMPRLIEWLHYRIIDVSTLKTLIQAWYPHTLEAFFEKKKAHRALDDIHESIAELKHYKKRFFVES